MLVADLLAGAKALAPAMALNKIAVFMVVFYSNRIVVVRVVMKHLVLERQKHSTSTIIIS